MSKIGRMPLKIPEDVKVTIENGRVTIAGPKGTLSRKIKEEIEVKIKDKELVVERKSESRFLRTLHGTTRALLSNMIKGVMTGFTKTLVLSGVGYRAKVEGEMLILSVGFSNQVQFKVPPDISFSVNEDKIIVSGIDKEQVGEIAASIRRIKPPEPYKGKGIRYLTEVIRRKVGKKSVATT